MNRTAIITAALLALATSGCEDRRRASLEDDVRRQMRENNQNNNQNNNQDDDGILQVLSVTPSDDSAGVSPAALIEVQFDEEIEPASADGLLLHDGVALVAAATWVEGSTIVLEPLAALEEGVTHQLVATTNIVGLDGDRLETDGRWSFTTQEPAPRHRPWSRPAPSTPTGS